jgi:N-glycosylase/DNA lyase
LDEDLSEFYTLCEDDPLLYSVPTALKGLHLRCMALWDALLVAILQQNASFRQGWRMVKRLFQRFGKKKDGFIFAPSPKTLLENEPLLHTAGVGYRRRTLINVAKAYLDEHLKGIDELSDREALSRIISIEGVGEYTAKVSLLFSGRRYALFPLDRWFLRLLPLAYPKGGVEYAKGKWKGWIGLFAYFVTVVTEASMIKEAQIKVKERRLSPSLNPPYPTPLSLYKFSG